VRSIERRFVHGRGFSDHRASCCVTPTSLRALDASYARCRRLGEPVRPFVERTVGVMQVMLASDTCKALDADYVLKRELDKFMRDNIEDPRLSRIVLITCDGDFAPGAEQALALGFDVQLVHGPQPSRELLRLPYRSPPVSWTEVVEAASKL
jgi:hypothetical protein